MSDANQLLEKLKKINQKKSFDIFIPTLSKYVKFTPFTLKQQKDLLSKLPRTEKGVVLFNNHFNEIIINNNDSNLTLTDVKNIDKEAIILQYKIKISGSKYTKEKVDIDLNKVLCSLKEYDFSNFTEEKTIYDGDLSAVLKAPNLKYENEVNSSVGKVLRTNDENKIMAELFVGEFIKYIQTIIIDDEEINFTKLSFNDKKNVIDELPTSFTKKIIDYMNSIKTEETNLFSFKNVKINLTNDLFA